ncbi:MAG: hypothetical protein V3U65_19425 [Granulosicoccaceae bacterium]
MGVDFNPVVDARLSIQRALLGEVLPHLRAVVFSIEAKAVDVRFYFDGVVGEDAEESASCVETEILADYDPEDTVTIHCIRLDYPTQIDDSGVWVYWRKE